MQSIHSLAGPIGRAKSLIFGGLVLALALPAWSAGLAQLDGNLASSTPYVFADDAAFTGKGWEDIQQLTLRSAKLTVGSFDGEPNSEQDQSPVKIHYRFYENPEESKGGIVISTGRTEGLALYQELIYDLVKNGFSVYIHDHRGQGFSSRLTTDDRGYIDRFDNYASDLSSFVQRVSAHRKSSSRPLFLLAHSMGGAIASLYLEHNPAAPIAAAALVTPMMQPAIPSSSDNVVVATVLKKIQSYCDEPTYTPPHNVWGLSTMYVDGTDFDKMAETAESEFKGNGITQSPDRYRRNWSARAANCEHDHASSCGNATAKVGGSTLRWVNQACEGSYRARLNAGEIKVPVLLLQGGEDKIVNPAKQVEFCQRMNKGTGAKCTGLVSPSSRHAAFIEIDAIRRPVLAAVLSHFECAASGGKACLPFTK